MCALAMEMVRRREHGARSFEREGGHKGVHERTAECGEVTVVIAGAASH